MTSSFLPLLVGATSGPASVTVFVGVTSITIQWGEVECEERNGIVTGYSVRYGQDSSTLRLTSNVTSRMITVDALSIRTAYSFEVAAVNGDGIGVYSPQVTDTTAVPTGT